MNNVDGALEFEVLMKNDRFRQQLRESERDFFGFSKGVIREGDAMENTLRRVTTAAAGFFTLQAAKSFASDIVRVRGEFQQLDIAFTTMLGSKAKADALMGEVVDFAGTTPFGLKDAANATKQLLAYGSAAEDVRSELTMLGDVAAGVSAPINDIVYLYGTLRTQGRAYAQDIRQFAGRGIPIYEELAKVLKINADEVANFVEAGKVGFKDVQQAFQNMTAEGSRFGGLMAAQSVAITGQFERLKDTIDVALNEIGQANEEVIGSSINAAAALVENYETVGKVLLGLVATYGAYKAASMTIAALKQVEAKSIQEVAASITAESPALARSTALKLENAQAAAAVSAAAAKELQSRSAAAYATVAQMRAEVSELAAKKAAQVQTAQTAAAELAAAKQRVIAAEANVVAAQSSIASSTRINAAKQLEIAQTERLVAAEAFSVQSKAARTLATDLETKKTVLSAAAKTADTLTTQANTAATTANVMATNAEVVANTRLSAAQTLKIALLRKATAAQMAFNASILSNPYVFATVALVGLAAAIWALHDGTTEQERAQERLNKRLQEAKEAKEKLASETSSYVRVIRDETETLLAQVRAFEQLQKLYPGLLDNLTLEQAKTMELVELQKQLNQARDAKELDDLADEYENAAKQVETLTKRLNEELKVSAASNSEASNTRVNKLSVQLEQAKTKVKELKAELDALFEDRSKAQDPHVFLPPVLNKKYWEEQRDAAQLALDKMDASKKGTEEWNNEVKKLQQALQKLKAWDIKKPDEIFATGSIAEFDRQIKKLEESLSKLNPNTQPDKVESIQDQIIKLTQKRVEAEKKIAVRTFDDELDYKRQEYEKYEAWVRLLGQDIADTQFADLIRGGQTYIDWLEEQKSALESQQQKVSTPEGQRRLFTIGTQLQEATQAKTALDNFRDSLEDSRRESQTLTQYIAQLELQLASLGNTSEDVAKKSLLREELRSTYIERQQMLKDILTQYATYEEDVARIHAEHNDARAALDKKANEMRPEEYQAALEKIGQSEKNAVNESQKHYALNAEAVKELNALIGVEGSKAIRRRIEVLKKGIDEAIKKYGEESEAVKELQKQLKATEQELTDDTIHKTRLWLGVVNEIGQAFADMEGTLGSIGSALSGIASQSNNLTTALNKQSYEGGSMDGYVAGAQGLINLIGIITRSAKERKEAEKAYYQSITEYQNQYNVALNEEIRLRSQLQESVFVKDYEGRIRDGIDAYEDATKKYKASLIMLEQFGQSKNAQKNKVDWGKVGQGAGSGAAAGAAIGTAVAGWAFGIGTVVGTAIGAIVGGITGLFAGKKKEDVFGPLLDAYPTLISEQGELNVAQAKMLVALGLVDAQTAVMLSNAIALHEQLEKAMEQVKEVISELAGAMGNDLRNALVQAFEDGSDAATAFSNVVANTMESVISNLLFSDLWGDFFKNLEEQMINFDEFGNLNWIDDIGQSMAEGRRLAEEQERLLAEASAEIWEKYGIRVFGNNMIAEAIQSLSGDLKSALIDAFAAGEDAADAFGGSVEAMLERLISNMLFAKLMQPLIDGLSDEMNASLDPGGDQDLLDDIERFMAAGADRWGDMSEMLEQLRERAREMGLDLWNAQDSATALTGAIKGIQEDTANILAGYLNAIRIRQAATQDMMKEQLFYLAQIAKNTSYNRHLESIDRKLDRLAGPSGGGINVELRAAGL